MIVLVKVLTGYISLTVQRFRGENLDLHAPLTQLLFESAQGLCTDGARGSRHKLFP